MSARKGDYRRTDDGETGLAGRAPLPEGRSMDVDLEAEREERRKATPGKYNRGDYHGRDEGGRGQRSPSPARLDRYQGGAGRSGPSQNDDRRNDYSRDGASTSKSKGNYTGRSTTTIYSDNRRRDDDRRQNDSRHLDRDRYRNDDRDLSRDRDRERNNRTGEDKFSKQRQESSTSANFATTRGESRKPEDMPSREGTIRRYWDSKDSSNISLGSSDNKGKEREVAGSGGDRDTQGQSKKPRLDDTPSTPSIAAEKRDSASNSATGKAKGIYVRPGDRDDRGTSSHDSQRGRGNHGRAERRGRDGSPPRTGSSESSFRNQQRQDYTPRRERSKSPRYTRSRSPKPDPPFRRSVSPATSIRSGRGHPSGGYRRQDDRDTGRGRDGRNRQGFGSDRDTGTYRGRSRSRSPVNSSFTNSYGAGQKRQRSPSINHADGGTEMRSGSTSGMRIASPPRPERAASKEIDDAWANYQPTGQVQASPPGRQMYDMSEAPGYTPNLQPPAFYRPPSEQPPPHFQPFPPQQYQPPEAQNYRSPPLPFPPAFPPHMPQQQSQAQPYQQPPPNFPFQQSPPHPSQLTGLPFLPPGIPLPPPPHLLQQEVTRQLALGIRAPPPGPNRTAGGKFRPVAGLPTPPPGSNDSLRRFFPGEDESVPGTPVTQQNGLGQDLNRNRMDVDQSPRAPPISPFNKQLANAGLPTPPHIAFPQQYQQPPLPPRHQPQQSHQPSPQMAQFLQLQQQQQQQGSQQATISPEPRPIILPSAHSPIFPGLSSAPAALPSTSSTPAGLPPRPTFSSGLLPPFLPPKPNFHSNSQAVSPTLPHPLLPNASPTTSTAAAEKAGQPAGPAAAVFAVPQSPAPSQQKDDIMPAPAPASIQDTPGTPRAHSLVQSKTAESPSQPSPGPADSSNPILPFEAAETPQPTPAATSSAPVSRGTRELYERIAQVGEGTYGKVYKARNVETNTLVAMKRIRMEAEKDGFPVTAVREIKLLQSLDHGNVVALREMMVSKGHVYMVFEYVDHDLTGILHHPNISFTLGNLKSLMEQLLQGLDYIHWRGVLHRDLKGSNILLSKTGELKIADFGLAKFYAKGKKNDYTNRVITQWYKPPELLFGATVYGPDVDMWSAGCIFLELFTKRPVFQGQDEIHQLDVIYKHMGTPTTSTWPELADLPWYELVKPKKEIKSNFRSAFGAEYMKSPAALDLAEALLSFNPALRPTAKEALTFPYFVTEEPKAERPTWLADIKGDWHEMESKEASRRKGREMRKAAQQQQQAQKDQHAKEQQMKQAQEV